MDKLTAMAKIRLVRVVDEATTSPADEGDLSMTATKATPAKAAAAKPAKAKADGPRTLCNFREGGWQGENFRALTSAPFACKRPRMKGRNHCEAHERMYAEAARKRAALRKDSGVAPVARAPKSAATSALVAGTAKARKPARNSGGAPRTKTPPVRPMGSGPVASTRAGKAAMEAVAAPAN